MSHEKALWPRSRNAMQTAWLSSQAINTFTSIPFLRYDFLDRNIENFAEFRYQADVHFALPVAALYLGVVAFRQVKPLCHFRHRHALFCAFFL